MIAPIPGIGKPAGRAMADVATLGLAELLPNKIQNPLNNAFGSIFFSPAAGLAAGGAGLLGAGGIGAGGMGAASPTAGAAGAADLSGLAQFTAPGAATQTIVPTSAGASLPMGGVAGLSDVGGGLGSGAALNPATAASASPGMSGSNMLQNAFLATSVGGMLGNAIKPPPPPAMGVPNAPTVSGGGFTPVSNQASQQWAQLMAQRRAQQTGKFTV